MEELTEYIFSINTGRSGSDYLANIFKHVSGCRSFHEPQPIGNGKEMRYYSRGHLTPMKNITEKKIEVIKELKRDCHVYFESNHCFIKGFGWFIPQYIPEDKIGIIILKREKAKIAESLLRIGCSPLTPYGRDWISTPDMKDPLVRTPKTPAIYQCARLTKCILRTGRFLVKKVFQKEVQYPQWLINYELECLKWYVEETYAKSEAFKKQHPAIKYYEVNINDLNTLESVQLMLTHFGCRGKESLNHVVGKPTNLKQP
jgi:hypothetical protein